MQHVVITLDDGSRGVFTGRAFVHHDEPLRRIQSVEFSDPLEIPFDQKVLLPVLEPAKATEADPKAKPKTKATKKKKAAKPPAETKAPTKKKNAKRPPKKRKAAGAKKTPESGSEDQPPAPKS